MFIKQYPISLLITSEDEEPPLLYWFKTCLNKLLHGYWFF